MTEADALLHLLKAQPTLLPPAPADADGKHIEHRRQDEAHMCLKCGKRAQAALIAHTEIGPRWLDLCLDCFHWLKSSPDEESP
jgi:hypothetical protein